MIKPNLNVYNKYQELLLILIGLRSDLVALALFAPKYYWQ